MDGKRVSYAQRLSQFWHEFLACLGSAVLSLDGRADMDFDRRIRGHCTRRSSPLAFVPS